MAISYAHLKKKQLTVLLPSPHQVVVVEYQKSQLCCSRYFFPFQKRTFSVKCFFYLAAYAA